MRRGQLLCVLSLISIWATAVCGASESERLRNERSVAVEYTLGAGEILAMETLRPAVTVYLDGGALAQSVDGLGAKILTVRRGEAAFSPAGAWTIRNSGDFAVRFVRVEFPGSGNGTVWGTSGLPANYKLLLENTYARVYDIRIPGGATEPRHTHRDRVVICLSGARMQHVLPDGREETATLGTGEVAWRQAATHVGRNTGDTDLWAIAVEPK